MKLNDDFLNLNIDPEKKLNANQEKILEANLKIFDEAVKKIEKEGCVVRDAKGNVLVHPALDVQIKVSKLILDLIK